ncbi:hypothetical protein Tco_1018376 [Tanacetum coccineum]|uniref:Uncharacterized protein n=1 Tax=Tanacetum coccineum TaxID=301880 RepID=A0ABQ5FU63_9ASTR
MFVSWSRAQLKNEEEAQTSVGEALTSEVIATEKYLQKFAWTISLAYYSVLAVEHPPQDHKETVQECDNVAEYKAFSSLWIGDFGKVHFEALEKRYNTTCVKNKHKEIWREVEVQVFKPPSWTSENVIEDIDVVEQATNAS